MRTKTLLIAAAALAVGIGSSMAQTYSANIVGYTTSKLVPGLNLVCPTVQVTSTNEASQVFPCIQAGDQIYIWNGAGFNVALYFGPTPPDQQPGEWYDGISFAPINAPLLPLGNSVYYQNNTSPAVNETNTFAGTVTLTNQMTLVPGLSLVGSTAPVGTTADSTNYSLPLQAGDQLYLWNGSGFNVALYFGPTPPDQQPGEWYDGISFATINTPIIPVGSGFYYQNNSSPAVPYTWTQNMILPQ